MNEPPNIEDAGAAVLDLDDVGEDAGTGAVGDETDRQTTGDLLAVGGGGDDHARGRGRADDRGEDVDDRRDEDAAGLIGLGDVDLLRTGRSQVGQNRVGLAGRADDIGHGVPSARAAVISSEVTFFSPPSVSCLMRTSTSAMFFYS